NCGDDDVSGWAGPYSFFTGYCIPTGAVNNSDEIRNFTIGNLSNNSVASEGTNGYSNYTSTITPADLHAGFSYIASLTSGSGSGSHGAAIWIDYNNNLVFDADEMVTFLPSSISGSSTVSFPEFTVPADTEPGIYRLRVQYRYSASGADLNPCSATEYSEIEDYAVNILAAPTCLPVTDLTATDITATGATLSWTSDGSLFDVEILEEGETPTGEPTYEGVTNNFTTTTPLTGSTTYNYWVRQDCGDDDLSIWTGPFSFATLCVPVDTLPYIENFDTYGTGTDSYPNCWS